MRTKRISADEARHLRRDRLQQGDRLVITSRSAPSSWNADQRSADFVMSSESIDRMGDIVRTHGIDIRSFQRNPVALFAHESRSWPIGTWTNVTKFLRDSPAHMDGHLVLAPAGGPIPEVDQAAWAITHGLVKGASIGFVPRWDMVELILDASGSPTGGLLFAESELVETSIVPIPANASALVKGFGLGRRSAEYEEVYRRLQSRAHDHAVAVRRRKLEIEAEAARELEERRLIWRKMGLL